MQSKSLLTSVLAAFSLSFSAVGEVVTFPEELVPLQLDNQPIEQSFFSRIDKLDIPAGQHNLKLKYSDLYEEDYDDHQTVESAPFWVSITIDAGQNYALTFNRATTLAQAKQFAKAPQVQLRSNQGAQALAKVAAPAPVVQAVQPVVSAMPNNIPSTAPNNSVPNKATAKPVEQTRSALSAPAPKAVNAQSMLLFWWQQASDAERQAFLQQIKAK